MLSNVILGLLPLLPALITAQSSSTSSAGGYIGYSLTESGDPDSAVYETANTPANVSTTYPPPDVFLNASVHVGEIDILVQNLSAKVNLDAQVLNLLQFNAGVDASVNRVQLLIQNVDAKVILEARLANLVLMINDVLNSIDLNPVLVTLGQSIETIGNETAGAIGDLTGTGSSSKSKRSTPGPGPEDYNIAHNILYSMNDYRGNTHTNRVLAQNGDLVDHSLNNNGDVYATKVVGNYKTDMTFTGHNITVTGSDGQKQTELEYLYTPFVGLEVVAGIVVDAAGNAVKTQVLAEASAGGTSTIAEDDL